MRLFESGAAGRRWWHRGYGEPWIQRAEHRQRPHAHGHLLAGRHALHLRLLDRVLPHESVAEQDKFEQCERWVPKRRALQVVLWRNPTGVLDHLRSLSLSVCLPIPSISYLPTTNLSKVSPKCPAAGATPSCRTKPTSSRSTAAWSLPLPSHSLSSIPATASHRWCLDRWIALLRLREATRARRRGAHGSGFEAAKGEVSRMRRC